MKERAFLLIELIIFLSVFIIIKSIPSNACVEPYSGMEIYQDTDLCPGEYNLTGGIKIMNDSIRLDCNNAIINGDGIGILINRGSNLVIENCLLRGYIFGISSCSFWNCYSLSSSKIINNKVIAKVYGILVKGTQGKSDGNIIAGNSISSLVYIKNSNENAVINNSIDGVTIVSSNKNLIENNIVGGINLESTNKSIISNNKVQSVYAKGYHNSILNNNITGPFQFNGESGIFISLNSNYTEIIGNSIKGFSYGIYLRNPSNFIISANNISTVTRANIFIEGNLGEYVSISLNDLLPDFRYHRKYIVNNDYNKILNAELNYFGTTNPFLIKNKIQGLVDYCPLLDNPYPDGKELDCNAWCKTNICPKP